MDHIMIFTLSFLTLALEILIVKLFRIDLRFYASSYAIISFAIFGFGLGAGVSLFSMKNLAKTARDDFICRTLILMAVLILFFYAQITDFHKLFWVRLAVAMFVFLILGAQTTIVFQSSSRNMFRMYVFNLLGAAMGALATPIFLKTLGLSGSLWISIVISLLLGFLIALKNKTKIIYVLFFCLAGAIAAFPSLRKPLPLWNWDARTFYDQVSLTQWNEFSRIDVARQKTPIDRTLSPKFTGERTEGFRFSVDGHGFGYTAVITDFGHVESLMHELTYFPAYLLPWTSRVLVIGSGGGKDVYALTVNAPDRKIVGVEFNPLIIDVLRKNYPDAYDHAYGKNQNTALVIDEIRTYLHRDKGCYDLIQIPIVIAQTGLFLASKNAFRSEANYLYTAEAMSGYLDHLKNEGILSITIPNRKDYFFSIIRTFEEVTGDLEKRIFSLRDKKWSMILLKKTKFTPREIRKIWVRAKGMGFQVSYPSKSLPYHQLRPCTDDRPYIGLKKKLEFGFLTRCVAVLALLSLIGLRILGQRACAPLGAQATSRIYYYFLGLGSGYIAVQTFFLQKFSFFIGQPMYAFTIVLSSFLIFNGIGAWVCEKKRMGITTIFRNLIFLILFYYFASNFIIVRLLASPLYLRIFFSVVLIAPLAFLLGMPFPYGLENIKHVPGAIAYAWIVNSFGTIGGVSLSLLVSVYYGHTFMMLIGVLLYLTAVLNANFLANCRAPSKNWSNISSATGI